MNYSRSPFPGIEVYSTELDAQFSGQKIIDASRDSWSAISFVPVNTGEVQTELISVTPIFVNGQHFEDSIKRHVSRINQASEIGLCEYRQTNGIHCSADDGIDVIVISGFGKTSHFFPSNNRLILSSYVNISSESCKVYFPSIDVEVSFSFGEVLVFPSQFPFSHFFTTESASQTVLFRKSLL